MEVKLPEWLTWDSGKKEFSVKEGASSGETNLLFDLGQVIEYYQR
jgi:hypothetical protein